MGKKKTPKVEEKSEFRKLHTKEEQGHVQYIIKRVGKNFESLGITHGKRTRGISNIPLEKNPNPHDTKKAYIRPKVIQREAKKYGKKLEDHKFSPSDKELVLKLIEKLNSEKEK